VGRLVEIKNIQLFIDGIKYLKDRGVKNIKGLIVGDGPEKNNLKEYCKSLRVNHCEFGVPDETVSIIFTSWCKEISYLYSSIDIMALTSLNEGTPYSLIEASIVGIPIIAADVGGIADIVQDKRNALLFNSRDEFYEHLVKLTSDSNLRSEMGKNGKEYANNKFDSATMAKETKNLYFDLINNSN